MPAMVRSIKLMRNIKLTIRYDGSRYAGWQFQKNSLSIQEVIQEAIKKITGEHVNLIGSGRTDAGVHAEAQVANFKTRSKIPLKNLRMALNSRLPRDIVITHIEEAGLKFNSQHHAKSKLYRYTIYNNDFVDPFLRRYAAKCFFKLDIGAMKKAAKILTGRHDFRSFQTVDGPSTRPEPVVRLAQGRGEQGMRISLRAASNHGTEKNAVRKIEYIKIAKSGDLVYIYMKADGFLYNMARVIAGTLVEVGRGKFGIARVKDILVEKDRRSCGPTMPAQGLCLVKVKY